MDEYDPRNRLCIARLQVGAPPNFVEAVREAARLHGLTAADFIRQELARALKRDRVPHPPMPVLNPPWPPINRAVGRKREAA